jgi:hypothetical protein
VLTFNDENNLEDEAAAEFIKNKTAFELARVETENKQRKASSNVCWDLPEAGKCTLSFYKVPFSF